MKNTNRSIAKSGLVGALMLSLTGCVTYEQPVTRTVYVTPPPPPVVVAPEPEPVSSEVVIHTERDFYEPLSAYGEWVVVGSFGRCWKPARVDVSWRPYSDGHWQRTEDGWYWASDEPWGWATYHYGRWDFNSHHGWIWVPQTQWAPAWVTWRSGAGYIGWAPLPPSARVSVNGNFEYGEVVVGPRFVFVQERHMLEPVRPRTVIVNNTTVINQTVNITRIKVVNKTVINEGPRTEVIERASGRRVEPVRVQELRRREETEFADRRRNGRSGENRNDQPHGNGGSGSAPTPPADNHGSVRSEEVRAEHATDEHHGNNRRPESTLPSANNRTGSQPQNSTPAEHSTEVERPGNNRRPESTLPSANNRTGSQPQHSTPAETAQVERPAETANQAPQPEVQPAPSHQESQEARHPGNNRRPESTLPVAARTEAPQQNSTPAEAARIERPAEPVNQAARSEAQPSPARQEPQEAAHPGNNRRPESTLPVAARTEAQSQKPAARPAGKEQVEKKSAKPEETPVKAQPVSPRNQLRQEPAPTKSGLSSLHQKPEPAPARQEKQPEKQIKASKEKAPAASQSKSGKKDEDSEKSEKAAKQ